MDKKTAEQIAGEIEKLVERCGVDPVEFADAIMEPLRATSEDKARVREGFRSVFVSKLQGQPEPNQEDLSRMIVALRTGIFSLRKTLLERAKALPVERGGRPKLLKKNQEADLNARIAERLAQGVEKSAAIRSAASKYGVSVWTAKRAWKRFQEATSRSRSARKHRASRPGKLL